MPALLVGLAIVAAAVAAGALAGLGLGRAALCMGQGGARGAAFVILGLGVVAGGLAGLGAGLVLAARRMRG